MSSFRNNSDTCQVNQDIASLEAKLSLESNDGFTLNIKKIKEVPTKPEAVDVEKCHSTMEKLCTIESKTASVKLRLQEHKNSFIDANHISKIWASNELDFLTQHHQTLENLDKNVSSLYCCISNTYKILSSRFTRDTVAAQEKKMVQRRKKEQQ